MSPAAGFFSGLQGRGRRRAERASGWEEISGFKSCSPSRKERENSSSLPVLKGEASAALGGSFGRFSRALETLGFTFRIKEVNPVPYESLPNPYALVITGDEGGGCDDDEMLSKGMVKIRGERTKVMVAMVDLQKGEKSIPVPIRERHIIWFGWQLVLVLPSQSTSLLSSSSIFQADIASPNSLSSARTRSRVSLNSYDGYPKIDFLFLARRELPLDFPWSTFFEVCFSVFQICVRFSAKKERNFCSFLVKLYEFQDLKLFGFCRMLMLVISLLYTPSEPGFVFD
ncbi:hypothetical protein SLEP1_g54119 [Rubroshorea leprosula]|uniref:Uncharacterized protein n=1 Tax=Rubroshorea leprosula TaxID=152421 RepID=A0AAV5MBE3_9ROSI|nr:hypothetical protein SLEP1_g54119 [Rubroshorea leprosula]